VLAMRIIVQRPKVIATHRKLAKYFVAYSGDPSNGATVRICEGAPDETAAQVRARAIDLLAESAEQQCLEVRAVTPGSDGRPQDVWILSGNPLVGYSYGRVYARGACRYCGGYCPSRLAFDSAPCEDPRPSASKPRATLHLTTSLQSATTVHALTAMLTHMADSYPESTWPQFLWGTTDMGLEAIRTEIRDRNARRLAMKALEASNG
jgi:hypothetical protein